MAKTLRHFKVEAVIKIWWRTFRTLSRSQWPGVKARTGSLMELVSEGKLALDLPKVLNLKIKLYPNPWNYNLNLNLPLRISLKKDQNYAKEKKYA